MHPLARPNRLILPIVAALLVAAAACTPGPKVGEELSVTVKVSPDAGPRTPEGARRSLDAMVRVARAAGSPRRGRPEIESLVRTALVAAVERSLVSSPADVSLDRVGADLHAALVADGLEARLESLSVEAPGGERRALLAPTTDLKVLLVGLDGYDWDVAEPLMAAGRMPALSGLVARGARARLQTIQPILSPVIWTSIATGRLPRDHGILDFLGSDSKGHPVPVTSNLRRKPAFWNVLSDAGVTVGVVGWWATWPAEPVNGFLVSDRVAYQLFQVDDSRAPSAGKVYPPALWSEVEPLVVRPKDVPPTEIRSFLDPSVTSPLDAQDRNLLEQFAGVQAQARTYAAVSLALHRRFNPRVAAYYFESPDTTCHLFMRYAPPRLPETDAVRQRRFASVVERSYEHHDRILARLLELADEKTVVVVVSDHGFRSGAARPAHDSRVETPTAADWHERYGVFVAAGPGIAQGVEVAEASVLDVFPTLLALLGMPVADDLAGRVLESALDPAFVALHPVRHVDTFDVREASRPLAAQSSPEDRAIIESLVAIGYVGADALAGASGAAGAARSADAADVGSGANVHNNTGTVLMEQGELEAAAAEFAKAVELSPRFAPALINHAHALVRLGRTTEAETELRKVLAFDPANGKALSLLSGMQLDAGRIADAESLARDAVARDPRSGPAWYTLGRVEEASGHVEKSREAYRRAAELDPDNPEPFNALGNSHESLGEYEAALEWYEKALAIDPTYAAAYNNLGLQQQRLGRWDEALRTYEEGRRRLKSSSILLNNLATWHHLRAQEALELAARTASAGGGAEADAARAQAKEQADAAIALYEEAMRADPLDPSAVNNLGALRGALGDAEEQLRLYLRAVEIDPRYADAWHNIGLWHHERKEWEAAHAAFARALAVAPDSPQPLRLDAHSLLQLGRGEEARRLVDAAAARHPRSAALVTAAAALREELGDVDAACEGYRKALAIAPDQAQVRARIEVLCR